MLSGSLTPVIIRRVRFEVVTCPVYPSLAVLSLSGLFGLSLTSPVPVPREHYHYTLRIVFCPAFFEKKLIFFEKQERWLKIKKTPGFPGAVLRWIALNNHWIALEDLHQCNVFNQ
jgi:hypothetical protein